MTSIGGLPLGMGGVGMGGSEGGSQQQNWPDSISASNNSMSQDPMQQHQNGVSRRPPSNFMDADYSSILNATANMNAAMGYLPQTFGVDRSETLSPLGNNGYPSGVPNAYAYYGNAGQNGGGAAPQSAQHLYGGYGVMPGGRQSQAGMGYPSSQIPQEQSQQPNVHGGNRGPVLPSTGSGASINSLAGSRAMIGALLDDEIIPTAIVIKNIPFAVQKETLLAIIESLQAPLPYAFNYHHDNGVFRGLAFANFRHPHEADAVVAALNGYDISGRKLRVEYKKVLQAGEKERIEREKAIKRMKSIQFDKAMSCNPASGPRSSHNLAPPPPRREAPGGWNDAANAAQLDQHLASLSLTNQTHRRSGKSTDPQQTGQSFVDGQSQQDAPSLTQGSVTSDIQVITPSDATFGSQLNPSNGVFNPNAKPVSPTPSASHIAGASGSGGVSFYGTDQESDRAISPNSIASSGDGGKDMPTSIDFNDPMTLDVYSRVLLFKEDRMRDELAFSRSLTQRERQVVHLVASKLGLFHHNAGHGDQRYVVVTKDQVQPVRHRDRRSRQDGQDSSYPVDLQSHTQGTEPVPASPGLRVKKSMPNLNHLNGPNVSRDPHQLLPQRSSSNLRYNTVSASQGKHSSGPVGQNLKSLFEAPGLGNGTSFRDMASPTSPVEQSMLQSSGNNSRIGPNGQLPPASGRNSATSVRSQRSSAGLAAPAPVGSQRGSNTGYVGSFQSTGSSASIAEEDFGSEGSRPSVSDV